MDDQEEVLKDGVWAALERRNISRRDFLRFCSVMTGALALPAKYTTQIVKALEQTRRPALVWLEFQDGEVQGRMGELVSARFWARFSRKAGQDHA